MAGTDILSLRWWFENRQTGRITIAQFPNWPLSTVAALFVVRRILPETGVASVVADGATTALLLYWGFDELIRGVNPWRRVLGSLVICWQASRLIQ